MIIEDFDYRNDERYLEAIKILKTVFNDLKSCEDYEEQDFYEMQECVGTDFAS